MKRTVIMLLAILAMATAARAGSAEAEFVAALQVLPAWNPKDCLSWQARVDADMWASSYAQHYLVVTRSQGKLTNFARAWIDCASKQSAFIARWHCILGHEWDEHLTSTEKLAKDAAADRVKEALIRLVYEGKLARVSWR